MTTRNEMLAQLCDTIAAAESIAGPDYSTGELAAMAIENLRTALEEERTTSSKHVFLLWSAAYLFMAAERIGQDATD